MHLSRLSLVVISILVACTSPDATNIEATHEPAVPYKTSTPSKTYTQLPITTRIILPTPTQVIYVVAIGDTLGGIADRYHVSLDDLLVANPGIQPDSLTIGTQLVIPVGDALPFEFSPTPVLVEVAQSECWPDIAGGLWCFSLLKNTHPEPLENLSVLFSLMDENGVEYESKVAYAPINLLPPGAAMPLGIYFPPPIQQVASNRVQTLTGSLIHPGDQRYLPLSLENTLVQYGTGGRSAHITGRVMLPILDGGASSVWILAIGYDQNGNLVGYRRWEADSPLAGGESRSFDFYLYSLGPEIIHVDFLTEAHP